MSHNAEKLKGGPFGIFEHPICCKISKKLKGGPFEENIVLEKSLTMPKNWKGDPLGIFNIHSVAKHQKIEGEIFIFKKSLAVPKKIERGNLWGFSTSILSQNSKKIEGGTFGEKIPKKSLAVPKKNERGDPLVSPGMVCYAGKQEKPFWFSSLGQMVHFDAIFCRTFKNYFGQFVWIEKKKKEKPLE